MPKCTVTQITTPRGERVTTNYTIEADLRASLCTYAGDTVGDFVDALVRVCGGRDRTLASVEFGIAMHGMGRLIAEVNEHGALDVTEEVARG